MDFERFLSFFPINPSTHLPIYQLTECGNRNRFELLQLSSPIYSSTRLPFYFLGVPGRQKGWMSRHGHVLKAGQNGLLVCPESKFRYKEVSPGVLKCLDLNEEEPLSEKLKKGSKGYKEFK